MKMKSQKPRRFEEGGEVDDEPFYAADADDEYAGEVIARRDESSAKAKPKAKPAAKRVRRPAAKSAPKPVDKMAEKRMRDEAFARNPTFMALRGQRMASGGAVSASRRADGAAQRGKTRGKVL